MKKTIIYTFSLIILCLLSCKPNPLPQDAITLFLDGKLAYKEGDIEYSIEIFNELIDDYPDFLEANIMLCKALYFNKSYDKCITQSLNSLKRHPDLYEVSYWLGRCYIEQNSYDFAEGVFLDMLKRNSQDYRVQHQLGLLKMKQGNYMQSIEYYKKALLHRNELAQVSLSLSQIYYSQDMLPEVKDTLNLAIQLGDKRSPITFAANEILEKIEKRGDIE